MKQSGIVRQRGEEFDPDELKHQPQVEARDPDSGDMVVITPVDYLSGLNRLLEALRVSMGKSTLDKRGELRSHFYNQLHRKPCERVSEFSTRFRTAVADLKSEGVTLPPSELGWFYMEKLGLILCVNTA